MSTDNIVGICLGIAALVIAGVIFWGGYAEVKRANALYEARAQGQRTVG